MAETDEPGMHPNLAIALAAFQSKLPSVVKGNTAKVATKTGGSYSYDYADLTDVSAVVLPALAAHGLAWLTALDTDETGNIVLRWELMHGDSSESVSGKVPVGRAGQDWQTLGGAITYARRYCLVAATGVAPGGDDSDGKDARAGSAPEPRQQKPIAAKPENLPDGLYDLTSLTDREKAREMYRVAGRAGHLGMLIGVPNEATGAVDAVPFQEWLKVQAESLPDPKGNDGPMALNGDKP